ncbi:restriction endonuclease [Clostridium botulinum]
MEEVYRSFYTKSDYITEYMVRKIDVKKEDKILEPSAGDGVFIDKVLEVNNNVNISAYDLNPEAIEKLKNKYSNKDNVTITQTDTLMDSSLDNIQRKGGEYDKVIGNPPYGGWLDKEQREILKKKYNLYSKETYSLFLLRCISVLKEGGTLSFIIPDTYLFLHRHTTLRKYLLLNTKIKEVLIFPSKFFPGVKFGYSNLSIITLQKFENKDNLCNNVRIIMDIKSEEYITDIINNKNLQKMKVVEISQEEIYNSVDSTFLIKGEDIYREIINNAEYTLDDVADCVTGIYTGNNSEFMKVNDISVKNSKGYSTIKVSDIVEIGKIKDNILDGIDQKVAYLPIVKGASNMKYIRLSDDWYIDWSKDAIFKYKTAKKARFQNSQFYFKTGIAIPMVKSNKISATLMENKVFDQSIVGVFPKKEKYLYFLLGLSNSDVFRNLIHTINPTANNSANYVKKVPVILPSDEDVNIVTNKVKLIINELKYNFALNTKLQDELNDYFSLLYGV